MASTKAHDGVVDTKMEGTPRSSEEMLSLIYEELRNLAAARMAGEWDTSTLQPTALVHEAWLRLVSAEPRSWQNCAHFFAAAAEAMRRILIDRARRKHAMKRGAGTKPLNLDDIQLATCADDDSLLAIDEALEKLAARDKQSADLVKLRFFVGMNYEQAAEALGISERSAKRCWTFARAWLFRELSQSKGAA